MRCNNKLLWFQFVANFTSVLFYIFSYKVRGKFEKIYIFKEKKTMVDFAVIIDIIILTAVGSVGPQTMRKSSKM